MQASSRPTREQLEAAAGKTIPDVIGPDVRVLFCGINPSLYSGATGHHFARPGNRFWRALHGAGFTTRVLAPWETEDIRAARIGLTNLVPRATRAASEVTPAELRAGAARLARIVARLRPRVVAVCGIGAYRTAFERPQARAGEQDHVIAGARVWVLPNSSGLNANHQLPDLIEAFARVRRAAFE